MFIHTLNFSKHLPRLVGVQKPDPNDADNPRYYHLLYRGFNIGRFFKKNQQWTIIDKDGAEYRAGSLEGLTAHVVSVAKRAGVRDADGNKVS